MRSPSYSLFARLIPAGAFKNAGGHGISIALAIHSFDSTLQMYKVELSKEPTARNLMVRVSPLTAEFFNRNFVGRNYRLDFWWGMNPKYEAAYIRDALIGLVLQAGARDGMPGQETDFLKCAALKNLGSCQEKVQSDFEKPSFQEKTRFLAHTLYMSENLNVRQPRRLRCQSRLDSGFVRPSHRGCPRFDRRHRAFSGHGLPR